jgi:excinuclease ABC subunit A
VQTHIDVEGARVHNLKNVSVTLPKNQLIVFSGLSGSGKSSLAFDTIFAEGQRRYMESLSSYARQFLDQLDKPDVDRIDGLSPAISIDQKNASHNPRSTVGTITEIYDYFRILFSSIGIAHCPDCGNRIHTMSIQEMVDTITTWPHTIQLTIFSPLINKKKGTHSELLTTLHKEGFSRVRINGEIKRLSDDISLRKTQFHTIELVVDRLPLEDNNHSRLFQSLETATQQSEGLVLVERSDEHPPQLFSEQLSCTDCSISLPELSPRLFSFNSPLGACLGCNGLGDNYDFDPELVIESPQHTVRFCTSKVMNLDDTYYGKAITQTAKKYKFHLDTPYSQLTTIQKNILLYGQEKSVDNNPYITHNQTDYTGIYGPWEGIITNLRRRYFQTHSERMRFFFRSYMSPKSCSRCQGQRLKAEALAVKVQQLSISEMTSLTVHELVQKFNHFQFSDQEQTIAKQVLKEIHNRLSFLNNVGLGYLTLNRKSGSLSGGEFQRIRLATQIGSGLTGVLYVLDEPSIGLHQRDNQRLIDTLKNLRDAGNTLIVVEHDEEMIRQSDYIVEIGPEAGQKGGNIEYSGPTESFLCSAKTCTAQYLQGKQKIEIPQKRRTPKNKGILTIKGASENNLKKITVSFPLGQLICVTGVSGSGKSSLIHDVLHLALMRHFYQSKKRPGCYQTITGLDHLDKVITIDQSPIGRTPRSNPATYSGTFTPIRELFSQTRDAKIRGFKPGRFSFNVKGGRCEACEGDGVKKIEMHFLSDVFVQCDVCKGHRYNQETLSVTYKGKTISAILKMTINESCELFENIPSISTKLKTLQDVGLGYIQLGQNATTLSGGEAQRVKLAKELSKRSTGKTLYLLDEPTTGLHFHDIKQLLTVFNRLVDSGNTLIVIEHNLEVIKCADHIIDMGPDGGDGGGQIVAVGTPEKIATHKTSYTGQFLKSSLKSIECGHVQPEKVVHCFPSN